MASTRRRRIVRRQEKRYYPVYRPRLRLAVTVGGIILLSIAAAVLIWAAITFK
jgi:hypothetical protein